MIGAEPEAMLDEGSLLPSIVTCCRSSGPSFLVVDLWEL
jgi:hypothetical protein